ncbi:class I SAM-dependent methyltransferase [Opitutus terrae]|uniref:Methyltransferase type 11 n=1 Tax=Opitutus terrae (strain DSM 11246 / JCM 15787 / PB90-1) TaxID=452637 RepID=B1ZS50_OPITP|nr:class I SAM-dependent methyltransferase [Opitutus terrae]ACB74726.1 Methyltransferase type 11 [Opitutus terrae PB90-1]
MDPSFWNARYSAADYVYGTAPNGFLVDCAAHIPSGPVLCLGEGEGRNAVFLAGRGHAVTAVDQSEVGLAKARRLAAERGVSLATVVTDISDYAIAPGAWAAVVSIFFHLPPALRRRVHQQAAAGLQSGGVIILEAYTPAQIRFRTGGPVDSPELLMALSDLQEDFAGLELRIGRELEREVREGANHRGHGAVVQVLARKP